jgi:hypothetical protein
VTERGTAADGREGEKAPAQDDRRSDDDSADVAGTDADGDDGGADADADRDDRSADADGDVTWATTDGDAWPEHEPDDGLSADVTADGSPADPDDSEEDIPLPWNTIDEDDGAASEPTAEEFEDLRFVGPKTAATLESTPIDVDDVVRKRVSYRDLTEHGVNPGVAAKIRREHSLSWSFDAEDTDLSRRSTQVRGLDDEERAWIAASSTDWSDADAPDEAEAADDGPNSDAALDAAGGADADAESEWRRTQSAASDAPDDETAVTDEEAAWRRETDVSGTSDAAGAADATDAADAVDGEAAWREQSRQSSGRDGTVTDEEAAWRRQSAGGDDDRDDASRSAEVAWREQSAPTPVTVLEAVDEDDAARLADAGVGSIRRLATADPESIADALELDESMVAEWCAAARAEFD